MSKVLDPQIVKKVAHLARLDNDPSDEFLEKYGRELGSILEYIDELSEVDTTGISPLDGIRTITVDELREDIGDNDFESYERVRQNIINEFPMKKGNLLELPGIFE